jgi:hypothetical protein
MNFQKSIKYAKSWIGEKEKIFEIKSLILVMEAFSISN